MSAPTSSRRGLVTTIAIGVVVLLVVVAGVVYLLNRSSGKHYSAMLTSVVGMYPGADVRMLGVPVGEVDDVRPEGTLVRVDFHVNSDVQVPAGALAAVVAPTVVADRYLQLAPVYTGGPTLPEGATIPKERTAVPAEFDDLLSSVQKLSTALGPQGVNNAGALSEAVSTFARNLEGNGKLTNTSLDNFSQAITTLSASRDDLAGTVTNLQSFTTNLKQNDDQVRAFTQQFAQVNGYLAGERKNLGETLHELSTVLGEVAKFIHDNRAGVRKNVDKLAEILAAVNKERKGLEQLLDTAPTAVSGLVNAYNGSSGTLDTRLNALQTLLCQLGNAPGLGDILRPLLPPALLEGCTSTAGLITLPTLSPSMLSQLKAPKVPLLGGGSRAPAGSPAPGGQQPAGTQPQAPAKEKPKVPVLTDLLGGGR
ncbi:MCE family protein [Pseudonocardia acaciae]|uniref:MCE family protein n=1 Tax=Pseudonocardia acaciae TaxID=551276 RepID=UPI000687C492|nr:MCE family protein [Pseudonocardia acaciae]